MALLVCSALMRESGLQSETEGAPRFNYPLMRVKVGCCSEVVVHQSLAFADAKKEGCYLNRVVHQGSLTR